MESIIRTAIVTETLGPKPSGRRLGAFDYLKWGHIEPIMINDNCIAAKVRVYA
jgi:hypothetical protein